MTVLLLRHAETDWSLVAGERWRGAANDLAPLTRRGVDQAHDAAERLRAESPTLVVSSPMTRALQTAAVVASTLSVPLRVELDLREWLPDESYQWTSEAEVVTAHGDMLAHDGVRPDRSRTWEPLDAVRARARAVLRPHEAGGSTVVAVVHEVLIHALTGERRTGNAQWRALPGG